MPTGVVHPVRRNTQERCHVAHHVARMPLVRLRMPEALLITIDETAHECGMTRSAVLRELIVASLTVRNRWPRDRTAEVRQ